MTSIIDKCTIIDKLNFTSANAELHLRNMTTVQRDAMTAEEGDIIFNTTDDEAQVYNSSSWDSVGSLVNGAALYGHIPKVTDGSWSSSDLTQLNVYLSNFRNQYSGRQTLVAYTHGLGLVEDLSYQGGVYDPIKNRIYLVPYTQGNVATWHYIDCRTGTITGYTHGASGVVDGAYQGGCYSPVQKRIYFCPANQDAETNWHYIDCELGTVVAYAHGATIPSASPGYTDMVYSPTQDRIYLIPFNQSDESSWHYIDCSDGSVNSYAHGASGIVSVGYEHGVYSPRQDRIYLIPNSQSDEDTWHYIDCSDGSVVGYSHGITTSSSAFKGGCYNPTLNRIYLSPWGSSDEDTWYYIDCSDGSVVGYTHGFSLSNQFYNGAVYSPASGFTYFVPSATNQTPWHYINASGTATNYAHGLSIAISGYRGAIYSATENRIWLMPNNISNDSIWHYIDEETNFPFDRGLLAHSAFNIGW